MSDEIKVTECWSTCYPLGSSNAPLLGAVSLYQEMPDDRPAILMWREDYDALKQRADVSQMIADACTLSARKLVDETTAMRKELEQVRHLLLKSIQENHAMRNDLEEWRQFKEKNKAMWQGAVKLIAEEHD